MYSNARLQLQCKELCATMDYRMLHTHTLILPYFSFFLSRYMAPEGVNTQHTTHSQCSIVIRCMILWYYCDTHLVDGEEVSALRSIRIIPFKPLVHVCFALPELARQAPVNGQRRARQGKAWQGKARIGKGRQGKAELSGDY